MGLWVLPPSPRRNWNEIVKLTAEWTDEKIMEVARLHIAALKKDTVL